MRPVSNEIGWMEAFDCDVEEALDQITQDPKVRGQIRFMVMTVTRQSIRVEMEAKARLKAATEALESFYWKLYSHRGEPLSPAEVEELFRRAKDVLANGRHTTQEGGT